MSVTGILGKKVGMTQIFDDAGMVHPVTVLKVGPCVITQLKTMKTDGYDAAQIGLVEFVKASKINKAMTGHFAKSDAPPVREIREVQLESASGGEGDTGAKAGDRITVEIFNDYQVCRRHRQQQGPRLRRRHPPARFRRRSQVARSHVPGARLDRCIVVPVARVPRPAHARPHGHRPDHRPQPPHPRYRCRRQSPARRRRSPRGARWLRSGFEVESPSA